MAKMPRLIAVLLFVSLHIGAVTLSDALHAHFVPSSTDSASEVLSQQDEPNGQPRVAASQHSCALCFRSLFSFAVSTAHARSADLACKGPVHLPSEVLSDVDVVLAHQGRAPPVLPV